MKGQLTIFHFLKRADVSQPCSWTPTGAEKRPGAGQGREPL